MGDRTSVLVGLLEPHEDELWQLQNSSLQLSVENEDHQLAKAVAERLTRLRAAIAPAEMTELDEALQSSVEMLESGDLSGDQAGRVFNLIDALTALARGEGDQRLNDALAESGQTTAQAQGQDVAPEAGGTLTEASQPSEEEAGLLDRYDQLDEEEVGEYCAECREHIERIELDLVELEKTGELRHVGEIFRGVHSIKGGAQYLGLEATSAITHKMETLLDRIRSEQIDARPEVIAVLLKGVDHLAALIHGAETGAGPDLDIEAYLAEITGCLEGGLPPAEARKEAPAEIEPSAGADEPEQESAAKPASGQDPDGATSRDGVQRDEGEIELFSRDYQLNMGSARELLEDLDGLVDRPADVDVLTRNLHTIKGIAGFVGLGSMAALADSLEVLLTRMFRHRSEVPHDIRRLTSQCLQQIDQVFDQFIQTGASDLELGDTVGALLELGDREQKLLGWSPQHDSAAMDLAESDHPLGPIFGRLLEAGQAGDDSLVAELCNELEDGATLHGYEELAATAIELRDSFAELDHSQRQRLIESLARSVPHDLELVGEPEDETATELSFQARLLTVPGIGPKKVELILQSGAVDWESLQRLGTDGLVAARGISLEQARAMLALAPRAAGRRPDGPALSGIEGLAREILDDVFDRELVEIYLTTTLERLATARAQLIEGDLQLLRQTVSDLVLAAGYMGYHPLTDLLRSVERKLETDQPELETVRSSLDSLAESLRSLLPRVRDGEIGREMASRSSESEEEKELEQIFEDSAERHLEALSSSVISFLGGMTAELLSASQHHLGSLESAATNIGKHATAELARELREQLEDIWLGSINPEDELETGILDTISELYRACGLAPPDLEQYRQSLVGQPSELSAEPGRGLEGEEQALAGADAAAADSVIGRSGPDDKGEIEHDPGAEDAIDRMFDQLASSAGPAQGDGADQVAGQGARTRSEAAAREPASSPSAGQEMSEPDAGWDLAAGGGQTDLEDLQGSGACPGGGGPAPPAGGGGDDDGGRALVEHQSTLRVDTEKIDDLMNMAAELVVNRSSLMVLGATIRDVVTRVVDSAVVSRNDASDLRGVIIRLEEEVNDLGRVSNQLQEGVMRMRMVAVKALFSRVPRLVRDIANREHRQVRVSFSGEETELDKTVIEQLSDPLIHLIRNAISHGIETPEARLACGKPREGQLKISAHHEGNMVILEVEDDGNGIDLERIRRRLVSAGVAQAADAPRMTERELLSAVFMPGFSTSSSVSDVSGRGVGLDVVKRNIEQLGGQVEVFSERGSYTRFALRIPLTMAIMQALLVRVGSEVYSMPVSAVIQTVKLTRSEISTVENQEVITVRDSVVPLIRLDEVFSYTYHLETGQQDLDVIPTEGGEGHGGNGGSGESDGAAVIGNGNGEDTRHVVVLQGEGTEIGLVVDGVVGGQDIVIKSLEDELVDARGVAGAAILGDGTVTLILDVAEIQKMAIDSEHYQRKRLSETMRRFERYLVERDSDEMRSRPS